MSIIDVEKKTDKVLAPIIFYPNLVVNKVKDKKIVCSPNSWKIMSPYLGYSMDESGRKITTDSKIKGKINHWMLTPCWDVDQPKREKFDATIARGIIRACPGSFHLNPFSRMPAWIIGDADSAEAIEFGKNWEAEYSNDLYNYILWLFRAFGARAVSITNGFEHSVRALWPCRDVRRLIGEISKTVYYAVQDARSENPNLKTKIIGFNDTIAGDSVNEVGKDHKWKKAFDEWFNAGGIEYCDEFGMHLYRWVGNKQDDWIEKYITIRDYLKSTYGVEKIWITETGYEAFIYKKVLCARGKRIDYLGRQAERWKNLLDFFRTENSLAFIGAYNIWMPAPEFFDSRGQKVDAYGLLTPAFKPRPAFQHLRNFWIDNN